jgi:hypothetical protein
MAGLQLRTPKLVPFARGGRRPTMTDAQSTCRFPERPSRYDNKITANLMPQDHTEKGSMAYHHKSFFEKILQTS